MKNRKHIILLVGILLLSAQGFAQTPEDVLRFSQYNRSFGTARSAAMGGAFTSLGADLSVMSLNPAGLGMYRKSEVGISPSFTSEQVETSIADGVPQSKMSRNRMSLNNIGGAFNVYNGGGSLTSVTFGFAYNKLIDLNSYSRVKAYAGNNTRLDMWEWQLADIGIAPELNTQTGEYYMLDARGFYPDEYGAVNSYNSGMIDYDGSGYTTQGLYDELTEFSYDFLRKNKGSVGQYDISIGFNFTNKFYFGLGFGFQDLSYNQNYTYTEYADNNDGLKLDYYAANATLDQTGSAWNFKFGAIYRPIEELRLAAAFHTPTYINIEEMYYTQTDAYFHGYQPGWAIIQYPTPDEYNMRTPPRLLLGASYTFFNTAILSLDYERVWYDNMKVFRNNWEDEDDYVTTYSKAWYRPTNNIRVGLETLLAENVYGRVGYAFYDSYYKDSNLQDYGKVSNYSAGLGYRNSMFGIDLAYIYMGSKSAPDAAYYYVNNNGDTFKSDTFTAKNQRHNITATLSYRF